MMIQVSRTAPAEGVSTLPVRAASRPSDAGQITVSREALAQLLLHLSEAYERFPTRKLRQALLLTEHMLGIRD